MSRVLTLFLHFCAGNLVFALFSFASNSHSKHIYNPLRELCFMRFLRCVCLLNLTLWLKNKQTFKPTYLLKQHIQGGTTMQQIKHNLFGRKLLVFEVFTENKLYYLRPFIWLLHFFKDFKKCIGFILWPTLWPYICPHWWNNTQEKMTKRKWILVNLFLICVQSP